MQMSILRRDDMKKTYKYILLIVIVFLLIGLDTRVYVKRYRIKGNDNIKIALLSDLHGCYYGKNMHSITDIINKERPDLVILAGDMFDKKIDFYNTTVLLENINYPMYYVTGEHELLSGKIDEIERILIDNKIVLLNDSTIEFDGRKINISGISYSSSIEELKEKISYLSIDKNVYNILIAHDSKYIEEYKKYDFDLICSGHTDGGIWRIPFLLNGIYTEDEGFFPKYAGGLYQFDDLNFIVSRGLSIENSRIPRFYNRPEIVIINIERK